MRYALDQITDEQKRQFFPQRSPSFWDFDFLLPVTKDYAMFLGEGHTPLIASPVRQEADDTFLVFLKLEYVNPTLGHKDRFQTVASAMAKKLCYLGIATVSTGNHGASCAAFAGAHGLRCKVFCPPQVSPELMKVIRLYGGEPIIAPWERRIHLLKDSVDEGYMPATLLDSEVEGTSNPFGLEGYKTIAYELYQQLGDVPDHVLIPCARGDTVYGVYKGFAELMQLGIARRIPHIHPCQPKGANALEQSAQAGVDQVVVLKNPFSVATSTMEPTTGRHAYQAMKASGGLPLTADDASILCAMRSLGAKGLCVEPASALPLACIPALRRSGLLQPGDQIVCLVTSSGVKWPATLETALKGMG